MALDMECWQNPALLPPVNGTHRLGCVDENSTASEKVTSTEPPAFRCILPVWGTLPNWAVVYIRQQTCLMEWPVKVLGIKLMIPPTKNRYCNGPYIDQEVSIPSLNLVNCCCPHPQSPGAFAWLGRLSCLVVLWLYSLS